ncbi:MAG: hypothetical protein Q9M82_04595 [Mariprofundus sp.]|nr:hypothetical protein [Mariprofundus sp.]
MAIQKTINNYLEAVEKKFGIEARKNTKLQHRGGSTFMLKRADANHPQVIDMGSLSQMTRQMQACA